MLQKLLTLLKPTCPNCNQIPPERNIVPLVLSSTPPNGSKSTYLDTQDPENIHLCVDLGSGAICFDKSEIHRLVRILVENKEQLSEVFQLPISNWLVRGTTRLDD